MAIALDASSASAIGTGVSSRTWSHTVAAGSNRHLVVGTQCRDATNGDRPVTGVTYNAVSMSAIREDSNGVSMTAGLWELDNPDTGAHDVVVTFTGTIDLLAKAGVVSLTGCDPSEADNGAASSSSDTPLTVAVTTITDNAWVIDSSISGAGAALNYTVGSGQTALDSYPAVGGVNDDSTGMSYEGPTSPAGSVTMSWTWSSANNPNAISAAAFPPSAAGGDITATATVTFSTATDVSATGKLQAATTVTFSPVADVSAVGKLSGTATVAFTTVGDVSARGKLTGTATVMFSPVADVSASGKLAATGSVSFTAGASLAAGAGALNAAALVVFSTSTDINARGRLAGSTTLVFTTAANLLDGSVPQMGQINNPGTLSGTVIRGALTASPTRGAVSSSTVRRAVPTA